MSELNPPAGGEASSADPPPAEQDGADDVVNDRLQSVEDDGVGSTTANTRGDEASVPDLSPLAEATAELDRLPDVDIAEHPDVYQRIHVDLQSALSAIDDA